MRCRIDYSKSQIGYFKHDYLLCEYSLHFDIPDQAVFDKAYKLFKALGVGISLCGQTSTTITILPNSYDHGGVGETRESLICIFGDSELNGEDSQVCCELFFEVLGLDKEEARIKFNKNHIAFALSWLDEQKKKCEDESKAYLTMIKKGQIILGDSENRVPNLSSILPDIKKYILNFLFFIEIENYFHYIRDRLANPKPFWFQTSFSVKTVTQSVTAAVEGFFPLVLAKLYLFIGKKSSNLIDTIVEKSQAFLEYSGVDSDSALETMGQEDAIPLPVVHQQPIQTPIQTFAPAQLSSDQNASEPFNSVVENQAQPSVTPLDGVASVGAGGDHVNGDVDQCFNTI